MPSSWLTQRRSGHDTGSRHTPDQPIVLSAGPLAFARRDLGDVAVRVLTLEMMLAIKGTPRPDEAGGAKDRADLAALRSVVEDD